ncbi:hypothetical protein DL768_008722 [Monosporascus sp. mg162]|nr:hypothetical protein DL768_008722 [Monosporascus sp. mg162]
MAPVTTIIISGTVSSILTALDGSAISTAMPSMAEELGSTYAYVWIANAYFLTMTAFPAHIRTDVQYLRPPKSNPNRSLPVRPIKGIGGGGVNVMVDIIVSDLVPLRERPKYIGPMFIAYGVGVAIGPVVGGSLSERVPWRRVSHPNPPIAAARFIMLAVSLKVRYVKDTTRNSLKRVDFGGERPLCGEHGIDTDRFVLGWRRVPQSIPWRVLLALSLGFAGLAAFLLIQYSGLIPEPTMPLRLFTNRTSLAAFGLTLIHSILMYWQIYFLPLYFQSILEASPTTSGIYLLPTVVISMIFSVVAGTGLTKMSRYRPCHFSGMALFAIGYGLFSLLDENSSTAFWAGVQCLGAISIGVLMTTTLPAAQALLDGTDAAVVTGTWGFLRCFGGIWGIAIPGAIFNSRVDQLVITRLEDENMRGLLSNGGAYGLASGGFITSLNHDPALKAAVKSIYSDSLKLAWQLETQFGLDGGECQEVEKGTPVKASDKATDEEKAREKS